MRRGRTLLVLALAMGMAAGAWAGTISMQVGCRADGTNLFIQLQNRGDEAAQNVSAYVRFHGQEMNTPPVNSLSPNTPVGTAVGLRQPERPGTYPAVIIVHFEDLNAYPFSSVTVLPVRIDPAAPSPLAVSLEGGTIRGKGFITARVHNGSGEAIQAALQVVSARELIVELPQAVVDVPPNGQVRLKIPVENFSAMPASRYAVHLLLEHEDAARHYTAVASGMVQLYPRSAWRKPVFWIVPGAALLIILVALWRAMAASRPNPPPA